MDIDGRAYAGHESEVLTDPIETDGGHGAGDHDTARPRPRPDGHTHEQPSLQHPGLVALLGGLLRASFVGRGGCNGDSEEQEAAAQAEGRQEGEEGVEAELGLGPGCAVEEERGWRGWGGEQTEIVVVRLVLVSGRIVFVRASCGKDDRVRGMGLAHLRNRGER
jgi:hypothetical protein